MYQSLAMRSSIYSLGRVPQRTTTTVCTPMVSMTLYFILEFFPGIRLVPGSRDNLKLNEDKGL